MYCGSALHDAALSVRHVQAQDVMGHSRGSDKQEMAEARIEESPSTDAA